MGNKITCKRLSVDERYTKPQGLYPQHNVNRKKLRRLILNSKLAPCFPGEEETNADFEECPICFLYYPSLNQSKCCSKGVCTECFLQIKSLHATRATQCPFCKFHNYSVEYRGSKTIEEKGIEVVEEQKFIEAKIHMHKQDLLDNKDQREYFPSKASKDKTKNGSLLELSSLQSNQAIHIEMPQQVKFTFDIEKWKQTLCEPIYCYDQHWLRKPCGPSLSAGSSSFTTCGSHCESNCSKCLMTFHKRRIYDVLDVTTPQSGVLKENKFEPYVGRWPLTWRNHQPLLSQSFPLPTRMPNYHYCHNDILNSKALEHLLHDVPSNFDGISICEHPRIQKANNLTQEFMTSSMSKKSNSFDDMDSSWVCEDFKSEDNLIPTPTPSQGEQATTPSLSNSKVCNNMDPTMLTYEAKVPSTNNIQHRNDKFVFDLEEIMVMEALWKSTQDQGAHYGQNVFELAKTKSNERIDLNTQFQINGELQENLKSQCQPIKPQGNNKNQHQTNWKRRRLASAIAALAEQQAMMKQVIFKPHKFSNDNFLYEFEPIDNDNVGELDTQPYDLMNVEIGSKIVSKNLSNSKHNKIETCEENNLHAIAMSLETITKRKQCLETSNNELEVNEAFINECQNDQCFEQVEDGASTSTHSAHSNNVLYVTQADTPNVKINRCACDINENIMLPRSFEEQMMLAMALSITDAH